MSKHVSRHRYDPGYPVFVRDIPSYIRFSPAEASAKIALLNAYIRAVGDSFSEAALVDYEEEVTKAIVKARKKAVRDESKLPSPIPPPRAASCTGKIARKPLSRAPLSVPNWSAQDTPILRLSDRWVLATDWELQWVLYSRKGQQWRAQYFPTSTQSLLWYLQHEVPDCDPEALATIRGWPRGHFNRWRIATNHEDA